MTLKVIWLLALLVSRPAALVVSFEVSDRDAGWVRLPLSYTAMKGDIVVSFDLMNSSQTNAVVHIESEETGNRLAELPIPIGLLSGAVIFPCGVITQGGPHKAVLTRRGKVIYVSPVLNVLWPAIRFEVPSRLESFESDVTISVAFTGNICSKLFKRRDDDLQKRKKDAVGSFRVFLQVVKCNGVNFTFSEGCSLPASRTDPRLWYMAPITDDFYRHSSYKVMVNCSIWSEDGSYRIFLSTNLTTSPMIGSSALIQVVTNTKFRLDSFRPVLLPCEPGDVKPLSVTRPQCSPSHDRIRAYAQEHQTVGGNIIPTDVKYLGEVRVSDENMAVFPCEVFKSVTPESIIEVCFNYITSSITGTTYNPVSKCLPTSTDAAKRSLPTWSNWGPWGSCTKTCDRDGTQSRIRFCQTKENNGVKVICKGQPVDFKICSGPPCSLFTLPSLTLSTPVPTEKVSIWKPLTGSESSSPCWCGCIFIVSKSRDLSITSGPDCPTLPILWRLKVSSNDRIELRIRLVEFSCSNSVFHVRNGGRLSDEIIFETEGDLRQETVAVNSSGEFVALEFMAPRRTCRINIRIKADSKNEQESGKTSPLQEETTLLFHWVSDLHLPIAIILATSLILVTLTSAICLGFRFEWQRRKYVVWKNQPGSGFSTPNSQNKKSVWNQEDPHTSIDEIPLLADEKWKKRAKKRKDRFRNAADIIRKHIQLKKMKPKFRSLPASPYLTRRMSLDSIPGVIPKSRQVTGLNVRVAAHSKSLRYQCGYYGKVTKRPKPPTSSPTKRYLVNRHSRSLSDIVSILKSEYKDSSKLLKPDPITQEVLVQVETHPTPVPRTRPASAVSLQSKQPRDNLHLRLKSINNSSSRSTIGAKSFYGSSDTLKAANSVSDFSQHSGDPELEFDLYDCDLNNASAAPGSHFAPTFNWSECDMDLTPTGEELELIDLFPDTSCLRKKNPALMNESRTSDLTASLNSNDDYTMRLDSSCFSANEESEDELQETDTLLKKPHILNLTHIDDISFADEEICPLKV